MLMSPISSPHQGGGGNTFSLPPQQQYYQQQQQSSSSSSSQSSTPYYSHSSNGGAGSSAGATAAASSNNINSSSPPQPSQQLSQEDLEEKRFISQLFSFMANRGTPIEKIPIFDHKELNLYKLYHCVISRGGLVAVIENKLWRQITTELAVDPERTDAGFRLRIHYLKYLYPFERKFHLQMDDDERFDYEAFEKHLSKSPSDKKQQMLDASGSASARKKKFYASAPNPLNGVAGKSSPTSSPGSLISQPSTANVAHLHQHQHQQQQHSSPQQHPQQQPQPHFQQHQHFQHIQHQRERERERERESSSSPTISSMISTPTFEQQFHQHQQIASSPNSSPTHHTSNNNHNHNHNGIPISSLSNNNNNNNINLNSSNGSLNIVNSSSSTTSTSFIPSAPISNASSSSSSSSSHLSNAIFHPSSDDYLLGSLTAASSVSSASMTSTSTSHYPAVNLKILENKSLKKYNALHKLKLSNSPSRRELVNAVSQHFDAQKIDEDSIISQFLKRIKSEHRLRVVESR